MNNNQTTSIPVSNETDSQVSTTITNMFTVILNKALLLCGMIALICIIILLIFLVIYFILRKKKKEQIAAVDVALSMKEQGDRHFNFKQLPNSSTYSNDLSNKDAISLSELRVKNKSELNTSNSLSTDSDKGSEKKKRKKGSRTNTESSGEDQAEKKISQKKLEKEIKKQIDKFVVQEEDQKV